MFGGQQPLTRGLWWLIGLDVSGVDLRLCLELERWTEVVIEEAPFVLVKVVDEPDQFRPVEPVVTQELAHVSPVFLLDEGVVVLLERARASEHNWVAGPLGKVSDQMVVEKLGAVVTVKTKDRESDALLDVFDLSQHPLRTSAPHCPVFGPTGYR